MASAREVVRIILAAGRSAVRLYFEPLRRLLAFRSSAGKLKRFWNQEPKTSMQVFISYRRQSAFAYARLLYEHLTARLDCVVFMDMLAIGPGDNFVKAIEQAESSASVVVVLITKEWLMIDDSTGMRPVDDPENWVRKEVAAALNHPKQIRVIPVLLGDVSMPAKALLPEDIASLSLRQAINIRDSEFEHGFERLITTLEGEVGKELIGQVAALKPSRFVGDLVHYFPRFLKLIVMPKRFIRAFTANREEELARAMAFLTISLAIFTVFYIPLLVGTEKAAIFLLIQFFMLTVLAFCSSAILQLSWKAVGGKAPFSRYLSINSYYFGVSSVLGICLVVAAIGVIKVFDPKMFVLLLRATAGDIRPLIDANPVKSVPLHAAGWIIIVGNLLLLVWTYGFWGAYREINNSTRLQSFKAYCISCVTLVFVGLFFLLVQEGLLNLLHYHN